MQQSAQDREKKRDEGKVPGIRSRRSEAGAPNWEELVYTRQFSKEWQTRDLRDTELGRVRKGLRRKEMENAIWGEVGGDGKPGGDGVENSQRMIA